MDKWIKSFSTQDFSDFLQSLDFNKVIPAVLFVFLGFLFARLISAIVHKSMTKHTSAHESMIARRLVFYLLFFIFLLAALDQLDIEISTFLASAGVLTFVVGLAARNAISHLISGWFLIGEKPFKLGDYLEFKDTVGEVLSVDLLSTKIRTRDNVLLRIPNEELLQASFKNLSHFPIRRLDFLLKAHFDEDMEKFEKTLFNVAQNTQLALDSPRPFLHFLGFGDSAVELQFSVWVRSEMFYPFKTALIKRIQQELNIKEIRIPVPRHLLHVNENKQGISEKIT